MPTPSPGSLDDSSGRQRLKHASVGLDRQASEARDAIPRQRWLLQIMTSYQWESAQEVLHDLVARGTPLTLQVLHEGFERHVQVEALIREWAGRTAGIEILDTRMEPLGSYVPSLRDLRPVLRRWDGVITSTCFSYPGFVWQFRRLRPRRVVLVDDGVVSRRRTAGFLLGRSSAEAREILGESPKPNRDLPFPHLFVRYLVLPRRVEIYSLFGLHGRTRDTIIRRELPRIPDLPMGRWILVAGSWGSGTPGWAQAGGSMSLIAAVKRRWPQRRIVFLQHPGDQSQSPASDDNTVFLPPIDDWRDVLSAQRSFPEATVSLVSTLAYLVRRASGWRTVSPVAIPRPWSEMSSSDRSWLKDRFEIDGWGPVEFIPVDDA